MRMIDEDLRTALTTILDSFYLPPEDGIVDPAYGKFVTETRTRLQSLPSAPIELRIVFDGPPGPEGGRFVEVEDANGYSIRAGGWHHRIDGLWELRLFQSLPAESPELEPEGEVERLRHECARSGMHE